MEEDLKISQLPSVTTSTGEEMIPVAIPGSGGSANSNGKLTLAQVVEKSQDGMVSEETWDAERRQFNLYGYINVTNNQYSGSSEYRRTGLLPLNKVLPIKVVGFGTKIVAALTFFDANGNIIKNIPYEDLHAIETIIVNTTDFPPDAAFFSCSTWVNKLSESSYSNSTSSECKENATADAIQKSKQALFDDMWLDLGYSLTSIDRTTDPTHPYVCNGLHLTYAEAVSVLTEYQSLGTPFAYNQRGKIRTNIMSSADGRWQSLDLYAMFSECAGIEVVRIGRFGSCGAATLYYTFNACKELETIVDKITCTPRSGIVFRTTNAFYQCVKLKDVKIKRLHMDISFEDSPLLSLESLSYLVTNAANGTTAITVTVHPDVYAKLTDTSNTEWHAVLTAAVAKNISFATNA